MTMVHPNLAVTSQLRITELQTVSAISQISFNADAEVAKQRELGETLEREADTKMKKRLSDTKCKELGRHDIFGPPPEIPHRPLAHHNLELKGNFDLEQPAPRNIHTSVKVSNLAGETTNILFSEVSVKKTLKKIHNQKFAELTGNDILKGDAPPGSADKSLSASKLQEMSGSDIFCGQKGCVQGLPRRR